MDQRNTPTRSTAASPLTSTATDSPPVELDSVRHVHVMYPTVGYFPCHLPTYNVPPQFPAVPMVNSPAAFTPQQGLPYPQLTTVTPPPVFTPPPDLGTPQLPLQRFQAAPYDQSFKDRLVGLSEPISLSELLAGTGEWKRYPFEVTTENFSQFLEHGCIIAQKIARRNQHRPCFKNIENLCNRMRNELVKPGNTAANIYSQGLPWATKDFIYAFIRLVNCWHMLTNYVDFVPGTLGAVELEISSEFRNAFKFWEEDTKILASHAISIFTKLNDNVMNMSTLSQIPLPPRAVVPDVNVDNLHVKPEKSVASEKSSASSHHLLQNNQLAEPYYMTHYEKPKSTEKSEQNILESLFSWKVPEMSTSMFREEPKPGPSKENWERQTIDFIQSGSSLFCQPESLYSAATTSELLWEQESGGLTPLAIEVLEEILKTMESDNLKTWLSFAQVLDTFEVPTSIGMMREKLNTNRYEYINQFIFDFKRMLGNCIQFYQLQENAEGIEQMRYHETRFSNIINSEFAEYDFSHLGRSFPNLGRLIRKLI